MYLRYLIGLVSSCILVPISSQEKIKSFLRNFYVGFVPGILPWGKFYARIALINQ